MDAESKIYPKLDPFSHIEEYPEIAKWKPENLIGAFWFPTSNKDIRIKILQKAILDTL